jgi:hypothetical protein
MLGRHEAGHHRDHTLTKPKLFSPRTSHYARFKARFTLQTVYAYPSIF